MHGGPYPLPDLGGSSILLVDHLREDRGIVASMLDLTGAAVFEASLVAEARTTILQRRPDAIITEMALPDASGVDLVRWIRSYEQGQERFTVVIALTRAPEEYPVDMARAVGFDAYFTRPPTTDDLTVALAALMSAHRTRRSAA